MVPRQHALRTRKLGKKNGLAVLHLKHNYAGAIIRAVKLTGRGGQSHGETVNIPDSSSGFRLNLGCGLDAIEGWVNVDKSFGPMLGRHPHLRKLLFVAGVLNGEQYRTEWPQNIQRTDIVRRMPWPEGSVDFIYSSHMVEHLNRTEVRKVLTEFLRVLRTGGLVRLALPDLHVMARDYLERKRAGDPTAADRFVEGTFLRPAAGGSVFRRIIVRRFSRPHLWMYDVESFSHLLKDVGFDDVKSRQFRRGECPDLELLENRPESFFVEAKKRP
jgi:SAM-dependent methyltransferase